MAIKFSELRELMKDTNIQTVKMSDSVYGRYMECMTHCNDENYMYFDTKNNITFANIHDAKIKNELYRVHHFAPVRFRLMLGSSNNIYNNIQFQLTKKGLNKILDEAVSQESLRYYNKPDLYKYKDNIIYLLNSIRTNNHNTVFRNCILSYSTNLFWNKNNIDTMPILQWGSGQWNSMNIKQTRAINNNPNCKIRYYNEYSDRDENINSGVILYSSRFNAQPYFELEIFFVFKATDTIQKTYYPINIRYKATVNNNNQIRKIGEDNNEYLKGNVYDESNPRLDPSIFPYPKLM